MLRERRKAIPHEQAATQNRFLVERIASSDAFLNADLVLLYAPIGTEINLLPLARIARERGIDVAFPISEPETCTLDFRILTTDARLAKGTYGIPEPPADAPKVTCTARTLCIVPGLSFAPNGARIGYGKGYYDRFLADFPGVAIGAVYESMLSDSLPTDEHDLPVSLVFTERGTIDCAQQKAPTCAKKPTPVTQKIKKFLLSLSKKAHPEEQAVAVAGAGSSDPERSLPLPPVLVLCTYILLILAQWIDTAWLDRESESVGAILLQLLVFIVPAILYSSLRGEGFGARIRLTPPRPRHLWLCACVLVMMITGSLLTCILTGGIASLTGGFVLYNTFTAQANGNFSEMVLLLFTYAIVPAFCEELIFRAFLCAEYEKRGVGVSIAASALFFAMLHFTFPMFLTYLLLGAILAATFYATRSFFAVLLLHVLYNVFCLFGQPYLSAFYVTAGSNDIFLFCIITLFLLFSAFAAGEARKIYHLYARANLSSDYTAPLPLKALPKAFFRALFTPATAICIVVWVVMSIINL